MADAAPPPLPSSPLPSPPPEPAPPPPAKLAPDDPRLRVGRARGRTLKKGPALAVVGGVLGVVVFALALALQPATPAPGPPKPESEPTVAPQPPTVPQVIQEATPAGPPPAGDRLLVLPLPDSGLPPREADLSGGARGADSRGAEREQRLELDRKAAAAGVLFEGRGEPGPAPDAPASGGPPATPASRTTAAPGDSDPNRQGRKNAFLDSETSGPTPDALVTRLQHPRSPYELKAGTIVPALLVTGINSDLPGPVVGQVRENVYDTVTGNYLLIPQGARLLATYDSMVSWGQERVLVCWNRLVFPNGDSIDLQCMPAADLQGAAGLTDSVDEHWWRILKGASVATLLAATTTIGAGSTDGYNPSVGQTMARNAAGEVNHVGQQVTSRNLDIQPTITVRPGYSVNVIITKDVILTPYRAPGSPAGPGPLFFP